MFGLGPMELVLILAVVLLMFGGAKFASLGRGLGEGIRNFKQGLKGDEAADRRLPGGPDDPKPLG
jgi:sec-independent protein translocase protein TatA